MVFTRKDGDFHGQTVSFMESKMFFFVVFFFRNEQTSFLVYSSSDPLRCAVGTSVGKTSVTRKRCWILKMLLLWKPMEVPFILHQFLGIWVKSRYFQWNLDRLNLVFFCAGGNLVFFCGGEILPGTSKIFKTLNPQLKYDESFSQIFLGGTHPSGQIIATVHRRLVTPNDGFSKGSSLPDARTNSVVWELFGCFQK